MKKIIFVLIFLGIVSSGFTEEKKAEKKHRLDKINETKSSESMKRKVPKKNTESKSAVAASNVYESERIRIKIVKQFADEEKFNGYIKKQGLLKKQDEIRTKKINIKSDGQVGLAAISPDYTYGISLDAGEGADGIVVFNKISGELMKRYEFGGSYPTQVKISKNSKYSIVSIGGQDRLFFFNNLGELLWQIDFKKDLGYYVGTPAIFISDKGEYVFCYTQESNGNDHYILFDNKGNVLWDKVWVSMSYPREVYFYLKKGYVLVRDQSYRIWLINLKNGEILEKLTSKELGGKPERVIKGNYLKVNKYAYKSLDPPRPKKKVVTKDKTYKPRRIEKKLDKILLYKIEMK